MFLSLLMTCHTVSLDFLPQILLILIREKALVSKYTWIILHLREKCSIICIIATLQTSSSELMGSKDPHFCPLPWHHFIPQILSYFLSGKLLIEIIELFWIVSYNINEKCPDLHTRTHAQVDKIVVTLLLKKGKHAVSKTPFKLETAGAVCSRGVGTNSKWQIQKYHRNCLIAVIASTDCATKYWVKSTIIFLFKGDHDRRLVQASGYLFLKIFCWTKIQKQCLTFIIIFLSNNCGFCTHVCTYLHMHVCIFNFFSCISAVCTNRRGGHECDRQIGDFKKLQPAPAHWTDDQVRACF